MRQPRRMAHPPWRAPEPISSYGTLASITNPSQERRSDHDLITNRRVPNGSNASGAQCEIKGGTGEGLRGPAILCGVSGPGIEYEGRIGCCRKAPLGLSHKDPHGYVSPTREAHSHFAEAAGEPPTLPACRGGPIRAPAYGHSGRDANAGAGDTRMVGLTASAGVAPAL